MDQRFLPPYSRFNGMKKTDFISFCSQTVFLLSLSRFNSIDESKRLKILYLISSFIFQFSIKHSQAKGGGIGVGKDNAELAFRNEVLLTLFSAIAKLRPKHFLYCWSVGSSSG